MKDAKLYYAPGLDCMWRDQKDAPRECIPMVLASDYDRLKRQYERLLAGVDSDMVEIDRIQAVCSDQFAKSRKLRMERDAALNQIDELKMECDRLRGLQPNPPPRPPEGYGLPRYGLRWNGPGLPLSVPMDDGYWTPYHLAVLNQPK